MKSDVVDRQNRRHIHFILLQIVRRETTLPVMHVNHVRSPVIGTITRKKHCHPRQSCEPFRVVRIVLPTFVKVWRTRATEQMIGLNDVEHKPLGLCIKHPRWATKKIILFTYGLRFSQSLENCGIPRQERSHFVPKWGQGAW